ncbi:uncharacterized protein DUF4180 [Haloactinopolyspora alba]|uniref:Uncharacterized protein DUF4180 n=1 Tax=Haloactinopolyspora alba TaxID=648780 RepID=A0A2P8EBB5_9ACTN|nr:DUF4180 domain-containing protein [Haloactinopolyspora alba]PSL06761.1 uncharacterized protein DUF4180 [Haloactinopolyspora alba]
MSHEVPAGTRDLTGDTGADIPTVRAGVRALLCAHDGSSLSSAQDALDLIGQAWSHEAELVILPAQRLDPDFFALSTGIAGEFMSKFVNYGVRLTVVGDISARLESSDALRDFVHESNRGRQVWFVDDLDELDSRLTG